jgi:hypothetical protein
VDINRALENVRENINVPATEMLLHYIKIKTQSIYLSHLCRLIETHLTLKGWDILFVNHIRYLGIIFVLKITCRLYVEMIID